MTEQVLAELARRFAVATEFDDWIGQRVSVDEDTLVSVLAALGVPAGSADERAASLTAHDRAHWSRMLPPTIVGTSGTEITFWVHVDHGAAVRVWIRLEDGSVRPFARQLENFTPPYDLDGRLVGEATFALPADLPLGYHRVYAQSGAAESSAALIVTPAWLGLPERLGRRRLWGLATQLYSVRSKNSWGTGDLTDLTDLAVWSAVEHDADFILVNPLHAAGPVAPMEPSPYLPTSRQFANPLQRGSQLRCPRCPARKPDAAAKVLADRKQSPWREANPLQIRFLHQRHPIHPCRQHHPQHIAALRGGDLRPNGEITQHRRHHLCHLFGAMFAQAAHMAVKAAIF